MTIENKKITNNLEVLRRQLLLSRLKKEAVPQAIQKNHAPIEPADRSRPLPLSWAQQRLWFIDQLGGAGAAYHIPAALRLQGPLDRDALQASLDSLVARHESLRTTFPNSDGQPVQVIAPKAGFALQALDLRALAPDERDAAVHRQAADTVQAPFDLSAGPLIRGRLLQLADDDHLLFVTMHHIISDGWSMGVLIREVAALYAAYRQGLANPLPPLAIQYADYAQWQRQWLAGETLQAQLGYWTRQLAGAPALLELPTDRPRPPLPSYAGASVPVVLDADLSQSLKALAKAHNATLYMVLTAAWALLLSKLSGQDDLVIGAPVANRQRAEVEGLIGFFVNTLALRIDLSGNPRVEELIAQIKGMTLAAYSHQDVPFEQVVEAVNPPRSMSYSPIFQVMLALQNTPQSELSLPGLTLKPQEMPLSTAQFDLTLSLTESDDAILGALQYASDLFDRETIERWLGHFKAILAGMVKEAGQPVGNLDWLSAKERHQVLVDFNATETAYPADRLIHELFEAQASQRPEAVAVVFEDQRLSYGELNRKANQLAHELQRRGVGPDVLVAICVERSLEMIVGLLAVLKAGGAYVPLDPAYPAERLAYMLADAAPKVLLTQERLKGILPKTAAQTIALDSDWGRIAEQPDTNLPVQALGLKPCHLAYVIYTSGSTGQPKGVMIEHGSLCNFVQVELAAFDVRPDSRVLQFASFSFDACVLEVAMTLCAGARLCLAPRERLMPGEPLLDTLRALDITHTLLPPVALGALPAESLAGLLTTLIVGGDVCPAALVRQWAPGRRFINAYGPTEATVFATLYPCDPQDERAPAIGRPIANARIYILDNQQQPVPIGVAGEIYIGGAGVARGYLNQSELTAERFIQDPFSSDPQARLYKTGDLGRWREDGAIDYLGRNDFQVKIRGFRIELGEIEARLAACAGVREAVVIAREDQPGDKRLVAYLTAQDAAELNAEALRAQLKETLPEYMVPSAFMVLDTLPLTANGKLDRKALPAPDASLLQTQQYEAPEGETEQILAAIWQDILGLERVGRHDNFFDLGGHSLLVMQMISLLRKKTANDIAVRQVFSYPTLKALANAINEKSYFSPYPNLVPIRTEGKLRPLFLIHPGEGEIGYARDLAPWLNVNIPVHGLAATGFSDGEIPLQSVYEMAQLYLRAIRHVQPQGPYRLAGWSAGGTIAYEIANQLIEAGESVEFLGLIDTTSDYKQLYHSQFGEAADSSRPKRVTEAETILFWLAGNIADARLIDLKALAAAGDIEAMISRCQEAHLIPSDLDMPVLRRHLAVRQGILQAVVNYALPRLGIPIHLFTAALKDGADVSLGWRDVSGDYLTVIPIGGTHLSIVTPPHIQKLGQSISTVLMELRK